MFKLAEDKIEELIKKIKELEARPIGSSGSGELN